MTLTTDAVHRQVLLDELDAALAHLQPLHDRHPELRDDLAPVIGSMSVKRHDLAYRHYECPELINIGRSEEEQD